MNSNPSPDAAAAGDQIFEDVSPPFRWLNGDKADTLIIDLTGVKKKGGEFEKEHLLVQVDDSRNLVVSGRRHLDGRRWRRFQTSHTLPHASDASKIRATFDGSLLSIIIPKFAGGGAAPGRKKAEEKPSEEKRREEKEALLRAGEENRREEKEALLRAGEEKGGPASDAKKREEKKKTETAGPNSPPAARREMGADPQSPPADGPRRRRRSSPAAEFTRRTAAERERALVVNAVAAAAVLLALCLYLVYRYRSIVEGRELLPISAV